MLADHAVIAGNADDGRALAHGAKPRMATLCTARRGEAVALCRDSTALPTFVIARLVRATQFSFSENKLGRPHKAGDDKSGVMVNFNNPNDA
jgi:hypothetical protein